MKKMLILLLLGVLVCSYSDLIIPGQPRPNRPIFTPEVKPNPVPTPQKPFTPKPNLKPVVKYTDHENLNAVLWMQTSAEFKGLCYQAYNTAKIMLDVALKDKTWCADLEQLEKKGYEDLKPAVILDIDETVLDNTIYQGSLVRENKAYNGREWDNWCREVRATAIAGAADFCNYAIEKGVDVVYPHLFIALFSCLTSSRLLLGAGVAAHELINTTCGVNQLALTGVEGVRGVTDFQLNHGISLAFEFNCVRALSSRAAQEHIAVAHVLEHYGAIVFGMDSFFHFLFCFVLPNFRNRKVIRSCY
jgi:hypothetical protein